MNEHAEVNGPSAPTGLPITELATANSDDATAAKAYAVALSPNPQSDQPIVVRGERGRFLPGQAPKSPGRPRKGESMPEKLRKRVEKDADRVVDAVVARLLREDAVGNRAFADVRDTVYGIPKQTLVLEQGASPLAAFLARRAERLNAGAVDGEATIVSD